MSIVCPVCGGAETYVVHNIAYPSGRVYRERHFCKHCRKIFDKPSDKSDKVNSEIRKNSANSEINPGNPIPFAIHSAIIDALDHARTKHPHFADTDTEAGVVIAEELLEVNDAGLRVMQNINDQVSKDNLFIELAQLNATTIRMMEKLLNE